MVLSQKDLLKLFLDLDQGIPLFLISNIPDIALPPDFIFLTYELSVVLDDNHQSCRVGVEDKL